MGNAEYMGTVLWDLSTHNEAFYLPVCLVCRSCCRPPIFLRAPCLCPSRWLGPCSRSKWSCELPQRSCRPQFDPISRRRHPHPFGYQIRCLRILWLKTELNLLYATICVSFYSFTQGYRIIFA